MQPLICLLSVVPVRSEPSHRSEMVSQILFGEYVEMREEKDDFIAVKCLYDGYEGWVQATQLTPVNEILETTSYVGCVQEEVVINGYCKMISIGCPVYRRGEQLRFGENTVQYLPGNNCVWNTRDHTSIASGLLEKICRHYLYTPYLWGGRSVYGIDCSGFVQQVFRLFGIKLLRDAYLQAGQGNAVSSFEEAAFGDLLFFQNGNGSVTHVGILLSDNQIVHAAGRVRIDKVDKAGIITRDTGKRTHHLHSIRRVV
jgi:gamma-D-glutamyl-L-lysine dipeptidyl-peptidase